MGCFEPKTIEIKEISNIQTFLLLGYPFSKMEELFTKFSKELNFDCFKYEEIIADLKKSKTNFEFEDIINIFKKKYQNNELENNRILIKDFSTERSDIKLWQKHFGINSLRLCVFVGIEKIEDLTNPNYSSEEIQRIKDEKNNFDSKFSQIIDYFSEKKKIIKCDGSKEIDDIFREFSIKSNEFI